MGKVRKASETDRKDIVCCILDAFEKDFSEFIKNVGIEKVKKFLEDCLRVNCFYLIENEHGVIGVLALSDKNERAMSQTKIKAKKHFGFFIGWLLYMANFRDFEINHCDSENTAFIEFVAVKQDFQKKGFASLLIKNVISETSYKTYLLDVMDKNLAAINCYIKLGFAESKREKVRFSKQKGFKEKIFMEYKKDEQK